MEIFQRFFELATFIIGVAIITLLIGRPEATAQVVQSVTGGLNDIIGSLTLQRNGSGVYG